MALWLAYGKIFEGWATAMAGGSSDGISRLREGLDDLEATGTVFHRTQALGMRAEALGRSGSRSAALEVVEQALDLGRLQQEAWSEPELLRIEGELLMGRSPDDAVESLERCLALAELSVESGDPDRARELLLPVYEALTEGSGMVDLMRAERLPGRLDARAR